MPRSSVVQIVGYQAQWREDFARLNLEWLEQWFSVEPIDREVLDDPDAHIIRPGGLILMALDGHTGQAVGTVALKHHGEGIYELTKMAVDPTNRGTGVGRHLMNAVLDRYLQLGGTRLFLESNSRLEAALGLYASAGFRRHTAPPSPYARADIYMVWEPDDAREPGESAGSIT